MSAPAPATTPAQNPAQNPAIDAGVRTWLALWEQAWAALPPGAGHAERRHLFETLARQHRQPTPDDITVSELYAPHGTQFVRLRVFRPQASGPTPAVLMLHGGAWMEGSPETHWDNAVAVASRTRATVLSIAYALTPEHPFPTAIEQCRSVALWVHAQAQTLGLDTTRLALWGDSAGANLAAALAIVLRDAGVPVAGQVLVYPALAFDRSRPSYRENADGPVVQLKGMDFVDGLYCRRPEDRLNPLAAPLLAASHAGLAPAMIAVAQFDPLRDDGLAYADVLRAAGVPVQLHPGAGLTHAYLRAVPWSAAARQALDTCLDWLDARLAPRTTPSTTAA